MAAAVLVLGGYFVWNKATTFLSSFGEIPDYPGPGNSKILVDVSGGSSLDVIGGLLVEKDVVKSKKAWDQSGALRGASDQRSGRSIPHEDADEGD